MPLSEIVGTPSQQAAGGRIGIEHAERAISSVDFIWINETFKINRLIVLIDFRYSKRHYWRRRKS